MKASERDELLGRLDERSRNTYTLVQKVVDDVRNHNLKIARNENSIKWIRWILYIGLILIATGAGLALKFL